MIKLIKQLSVAATITATITATLTASAAFAADLASAREVLSLDQGWRFHPGDIPMPVLKTHDESYANAKAGKTWGAAAPEYDATGWRELDLPHDWAVEGPFDENANLSQGYRPRGIGWYRRQFRVEEADRGKHLELQFDGVATHCTVWFNGGVVTNAGSVFPFAPKAKEVGTHWISVDTSWANGSRSNQNWLVRVRIALPTSGTNYYVALNGLDSNPGTLAAPFLTLERARNAIRTNGVPAGGVSVWVRGGVYQRTNTFDLTSTDSGLSGAPIIYRAYPGETPTFTTGTPINSNSFTTLNSNLWSRVMPGVTASNILELDLVALGITSRGPFPTEYSRCPILNPFSTGNDGGLCELYFNGTRQRISRYPNNNPTNRWLTPYMKMNGVVFKLGTNFMGTNIGGMFKYNTSDESHISRWQTAAAETNLWIQGFWRVPWESEGERVLLIDTVSNTIATASGATPGVTGFGNKYSGAAGSFNEPYWALNLLEEIDQPGEWAIDFFRKKLYLLPPGPVTNGAVVIADRGVPVIRSTSANNIVSSGLTFDMALERGIALASATNNLVLGCTFKNLGSYAVDINGGVSNGVVSCEMTQLAAGGVYVQGGSETSPRVSCDHFVVNNNITDFAQVVPVYAGGVDAGFGGMAGGGGGGGHKVCVGARIAHNRFKGTPHGPVIRGSFDKVFEYNWIEEYTTISGDFGGIYNYQSTNGGGFDILRYNYMYAPTNYVYPTYLNPGPTGGIGIQVDSTWVGDEMYGNIATCRRSGFGAGGGGGAGAKFYNNFTVNCGAGGTSWSGLPSVYATNFGALGSTAFSGDVTGPNFTYATDPGFINWPKRDLRLEPTSTVYSDLPGFREVPFEMIGLYNDEYRTNATPPAPVIRNLTAATAITTNGATLNGELVFPWVTPDTTVRVFWGTTNGGTNAANWSNSIHLGISTRAKFATNVTGLLPSQTYFYRFQASNSTHVVWASNTVSFVIPNPGYEATISFPGYTRAEVLTNIPMLVTLSTNIPEFSYARFTSATGGDLRFKTMDGLTDLNFEIESWNTNGDSRVWVQVPALTPTASILARWGDPVATNLPASSLNGSTWNNGYVGVYHLKSTTVTDSSPVPKNASANSGTATSGIVAGGLNYNGTSQSTTIPHHGDFNLAANFEIQGWFKMNAADKQDYRTLTSKEIDFNNRDWWITVRTNGTLWWKSGTLLDVSSGADLANGQWHHFAAVHDGATARLYVDGSPVAADATPGSADTQNSSVYLGFETSTTRYHKGPLDEFRFSNVKRSSNWVWAVYQNISSNSTFVGFSAITNLLPAAPASLTASAANGQIILNWSASTGANNYLVKRSETNGGPYTVIANLTGLAFTNTGLVNGTTYYYVVAGVNSRGEGAPSSQASATPLVNSVKANNTVDLDLAGSWVNSTVPTGALAIWDVTVTTNSAVTIGNGVSFAGLQISDPGTNIVINPGSSGIMELGASGLDLALSSQRLTVNAPLGLIAGQVWKTGNHSTPGVSQIVVSNIISGPGSLTLDNANTRAVLLASFNTFSGGFTLGGSATVKFAPLNATGAGGIVSSNMLGLGPLTINGGVFANTAQFGLDQGIAHSSITVNGDFALNPPGGQNAGRIMIAGAWNLGGELRTVSTTRATTASGALTAGGFTSWGLGAIASVASTVSNGTLRVVRDPAAGGTYVSFRANNPSFAGNAGLTLGSNVICTVPNTWAPAVGNMAALTIEAGGYLNLGESSSSRNVSINSLAGEGTVGNFNTSASVGTSTLTINGGSQLISTTFSGRLVNTDTNLNAGSSNGILALTKAGSSTQILEGNNSYTGATAVSGGVLILNGDQSAAMGPVTVASGATLAGTGVIGGVVTVSNGATLFTGNFPSTLTVNSNLSLAGTTRLAIGRNGAVLTNDAIAVVNLVTYGGTLVISNLGVTTLQPGDSFPLFPAGGYSGSFANIVYPAGYTFSNSLATDGRITLLTGPPNTPPALVPLGDLFATAGQWLYVTNIATDAESPPQTLTFSLLSAQSGASIATNTGVFAWHIPIASGGTIETITVRVADNGTPSLSDTQSLVVFIGAATTPQISSATLSNGLFRLLITGDVGPDYTVQSSTNLTAWSNLLTTNPTSMPLQWSDNNALNIPTRFYRALLGP